MKKNIEIIIILILFVGFIFIGKNKLAVLYYNQGQVFYQKQMYKKAIEYFIKSLKINPSIDTVHYSLGNAYLQEKLEDEAVREYKEAIKINSRFIWGYEALADIYTRKGLYQKTIDMLTEAQAIAVDNKEIADLIKYTSSIYLSALLNTSIDYFQANDKAKAYELLNKALEINPSFAYTYYTLGYFYFIDQRYDQAIEMLSKAVKIDNEFFLAHKLLGDIYFKKHLFYKAINEYKRVLLVDKFNAMVISNLGLAYMNLEMYQEAVPFLKRAVSLDPKNISFRYSLASIYRDQGKFKEAALEYQRVIDLQPDYPNVYNDLGDVYKNEGRIEEANREYNKEIFYCQKRLLKNPNDYFALNDISYAYNEIKDYNNAKLNIEKAIALKPEFQEAFLTLSKIQRSLGQKEDALITLEKAKSLAKQKQIFIDNEVLGVKKDLDIYYQSKVNLKPIDKIYLKNGRIFEGVIQKEDSENIVLVVNIGISKGTVTLSRKNIEKVIKGDKD